MADLGAEEMDDASTRVPDILISGVSVAYTTAPETRVLDNVDLRIDRGSFIGITGLNGAGKSSLCRLIAGYIPHFFDVEMTGTVSIRGVDTSDTTIGSLAETVGFVFENPFDQLSGANLTVLEEAAFALENMGVPRTEIADRARASLATVGIENLSDRDPARLSGGQTQRLALASVLALRPGIVVLDDPTSQLDPLGAETVFSVLDQLHEQGFTVVVVSQDLELLASRVDRLVVLEEGRIRWDGEPRTVLSEAMQHAYPIAVPDVMRVWHLLHDAGHLPSESVPPLTVAEAAAQLAPLAQAASTTPPVDIGTSPAAAETGKGGVVFSDVQYVYPGGVAAIQDLSLTLEGGCICVIGQNGAGKSTFARHLNGLLKPTAGDVAVLGQTTAERAVSDLARHVGLAFQNPDDQLFRRTVEDEIRFGPQNIGASSKDIELRTEEALSLLDLSDVRERKPHDLDLARRKHVATASVVAMNTDVLVLDEPTGGQDASGTALLGTLVRRVADQGRTVIVITHDMNFVAEYADRVVVLAEGSLLADGDARTVFGQQDILQRAHVTAPAVTQLADALGMASRPMSPEEFVASLVTAEGAE